MTEPTWGWLALAAALSLAMLGIFFAVAGKRGRGRAPVDPARTAQAWERLRSEIHIFGSTGWNRNVENLAEKDVDEEAVDIVHGGFRKSRRNFLYGTHAKLLYFADEAERIDPTPFRARAFRREAERLRDYLTRVDETKLAGTRLARTSAQVTKRARRLAGYIERVEGLVTEHFFVDLERALREIVYGTSGKPLAAKPAVEIISPAPEEKIWLALPDALFRAAIREAIGRVRGKEGGVKLAYTKVGNEVIFGVNGPERDGQLPARLAENLLERGAGHTVVSSGEFGTTIELRIPVANPAELPGRLVSRPE